MTVASVLIRVARATAGKSQRALSATAGTSGATIAAYEAGSKDPRSATLSRILGAAGCELSMRPRRTRNEIFVDLMCERLADAVLDEPEVLARARQASVGLDSAWSAAWGEILEAGAVAVASVLTSTHPAARPLKADTPLAVLGIVDDDQRRQLLDRALEMHRAS